MSGWFRAERDTLDDPWFCDKPYNRYAAWSDLIKLAAVRPVQIRVNGKPVALERGELTHSMRFLAERWGWSKSKVQRFISDLVERDSIGTRSVQAAGQRRDSSGTAQLVLTIRNYGKFQPETEVSGTASGQQRDSDRTTRDTGAGQRHNGIRSTEDLSSATLQKDPPLSPPQAGDEARTPSARKSRKKLSGAKVYPEHFEAVWADWRSHPSLDPGGKESAFRAWDATDDVGRAKATAAIPRYAAEIAAAQQRRPDRQSQHFSTWLNGQGYLSYKFREVSDDGEVRDRGRRAEDGSVVREDAVARNGVSARDGATDAGQLAREDQHLRPAQEEPDADPVRMEGGGQTGPFSLDLFLGSLRDRGQMADTLRAHRPANDARFHRGVSPADAEHHDGHPSGRPPSRAALVR